ncbi:hypothetical protein [Amycolatopsis kentuckyensis]|uniref:hypothetical protein n=1 Tax=Amycolatopsis kentuckyensis TaxID=218823 RepID=UPI001302B2E1|nr:hypothetical protein [Amycolatopsis kentuckyensis]
MSVVKAVLWPLWGIGVLNLGALGVSLAMCEIGRRRGSQRFDFLPVGVGALALVTTSVGCLSGLALILLSDAGVVLIAGTAVQLLGPALLATALLSSLWDSWQTRRRLLPRDEVVRLIQAGLVRSFKRRFGVVKLSFHPQAVKEFRLRTRHARREDYPAFVTAANERDARGRTIPYVRKPQRPAP